MRALASLSIMLLTGHGWWAPWSLGPQAQEIRFFSGHKPPSQGGSYTCQEDFLLSRCRLGSVRHSNLSFLCVCVDGTETSCFRQTQTQAESSRPAEPGTMPRRPCEEIDSRA